MSNASHGDRWCESEGRPDPAHLPRMQTPTSTPTLYEDPYAWVPPSWHRAEVHHVDGPAPRGRRPAHRKRTRRRRWPVVASVIVVVGAAGLVYSHSGGSGQKAALPFTGATSSAVAGTDLAGRWRTLTDSLVTDLAPLAQEAADSPPGPVSATTASPSGLDAVRNGASSATGLLTTYVTQLGSLPWTSSTTAPSHVLVESSVAYRSSFERIQAISSSTTPVAIAAARAMVSTEGSNWRAALLAVMAALGITDPIISGSH